MDHNWNSNVDIRVRIISLALSDLSSEKSSWGIFVDKSMIIEISLLKQKCNNQYVKAFLFSFQKVPRKQPSINGSLNHWKREMKKSKE